VGEQGNSRETVDRSRTREHVDQGVTRKSVVWERRQVPVNRALHGNCTRFPQKELDTCGKRTSGADAQLVESPDRKVVGCNSTCMEEYESHKAIIRSSSLTPGVNYQFYEGVDIKGISNTANAAAPSNKGASSCITDGLKNNFLNEQNRAVCRQKNYVVLF